MDESVTAILNLASVDHAGVWCVNSTLQSLMITQKVLKYTPGTSADDVKPGKARSSALVQLGAKGSIWLMLHCETSVVFLKGDDEPVSGDSNCG